jgi:hypothetical protein
MLNETRIPGQRVAITEDDNRTPSREWFRFFNYLYNLSIAITPVIAGADRGAFYDTTNTAWIANTPSQVPIGSTSLLDGVTVAASKIALSRTGIYTITASFQLSNNDNTNDDDMTIWLRVNGADIAYTASRMTVAKKHAGIAGSALMTVNFLYSFTAGDYFELYGLSALGYAQIVTYAASSSPAYPAAPGTILTVAQIL